jgi:hypothetical protein
MAVDSFVVWGYPVNIDRGERRVAMIETKTVGTGSPVTVVRYQYDNHLGSATLECDESGEIISYEEFHPYGTTAWWAQDSSIQVSLKRYRYIGMERDDRSSRPRRTQGRRSHRHCRGIRRVHGLTTPQRPPQQTRPAGTHWRWRPGSMAGAAALGSAGIPGSGSPSP